MKHVAILVADKNMEFALKAILKRPTSLGIPALTYEIIRHNEGDGGVRTTGPETLARLRKECQYGILVMDWDGSGSDAQDAPALESDLEARLEKPWQKRALALVIEPELETWVWGSDNAMRAALEWDEPEAIRDWLEARGHQFDRSGKPSDPKRALENVMYKISRPRSSTLYWDLIAKISLERCTDRTFNRLKMTLQIWFSGSQDRDPRPKSAPR